MIYLDNAATTKPNETALSRAQRYLTEVYFNPSALYREGFDLHLDLKSAKARILSHVADRSAFDLVFTSCGTEADNQAVFGFGKRGNVVTTQGEHAAVYASVTELKNRGVEPRFAPLNRDGSVDIDALLGLVDEKTSLVSVIHVNNETGAINDINRIAALVKRKNPRTIFHSDGVQAFGKIPYKLSREVDLYAFSAHKIGGLKGCGGLIWKKGLHLSPYLYGGGQENGLRSGTENVFGIKVLEYAAEEKFSRLREDFSRLSDYRDLLKNGLDASIFVPISGENASPYILSITAKGVRGEILLHKANDRGLLIGTGSACSSNAKRRYSRVILACGYGEAEADGVLRLSFSPDTTKEEVVAAAEILNGCGAELKKEMSR